MRAASSIAIGIASSSTSPLRAQGTTIRVSSPPSPGAQSNEFSFGYSMAADGRYVGFDSYASNLVPGDVNDREDAFVYDRLTGRCELVALNSSGVQGNLGSGQPSLSHDGRYVAFYSDSTNLVPNDTNAAYDVFLRDRAAGITTLVSVNLSGPPTALYAAWPFISASGDAVVFLRHNTASNDLQLFLYDRATAAVTLVPTPPFSNTSYQGSLSADGRFVAYHTSGGPTVTQAYVHDRQLGSTIALSVDSTGAPSGYSFAPSVAHGGRFIAFTATGALIPADTNGVEDVYVRDIQLGTLDRVSVSSTGTQGDAPSYRPTISTDGRFVAFQSRASNLLSSSTNGIHHIYVRDRMLGTTRCASISSTGQLGNNGTTGEPFISGDGRSVAFFSQSTNLVPGDTNDSYDVFLNTYGSGSNVTYCTGGTSSSGCVARVEASTAPSASGAWGIQINALFVEPQKQGLFFYGINNSGFTPFAWGGGSSFMCVQSPRQRTPVQSSGGTLGSCDGFMTLDWFVYQQTTGLLGQPWTAGEKVYIQAWFRDPSSPATTNLSDAVELTHVP